jgi:uncharacterized membrane protein YfcA
MQHLLTGIGEFFGSLTPGLMAATAAAIFAAAVFRGFTGFGFALAAVPLLGLVMSPARAVPVAAGLQLLGGLLDFRSASKTCHWPSLRWLIIGAAVGSPIGALILVAIPAPISRLLISAITLLAVFVLGQGFKLVAVPTRTTTSVTGFLAGLFNGLAAMPGPPAVAYYMSTPLSPDTVRASLMVFFLATSISAVLAAATVGLIDSQVTGLLLLCLPVMWVGTRIGERAFTRGTQAMHRHVSIVSLGLIAIGSAIKGLSELA